MSESIPAMDAGDNTNSAYPAGHLDWPGFPPLLDDLAAGCPVSPEKAAGMRAALRVVAHRLDWLAVCAAPAGQRNGAAKRLRRQVLEEAADLADQIRWAVRPTDVTTTP